MTRFQFAKLISSIAWEKFQPMKSTSRLNFDWRMTQLALDKINECSDEELFQVLNCESLAVEMANMYVNEWKFKIDSN